MNNIKRKPYADGIERDLLTALIMACKKNQTTEARLQEISKQYLLIADEPRVEELVKKFYKLGKQYREIEQVAAAYLDQYYKDFEEVALSRTHMYLKNGNVEKALLTALGGTHYDRN